MAKVICEAECPACGEMVQIRELGFTYCPHCKKALAELTVNWDLIEDEDEAH